MLGTSYAIGDGPLWWSEDQCLLFSEVRGYRRWKWSSGDGVTLDQEPTNNANGLASSEGTALSAINLGGKGIIPNHLRIGESIS